MKIKNLLAIILAFLLIITSLSVIASAEGVEDDSDFVDTPTLPTCETIDVSVVFRPLEGLISFAGFGPVFDGTVLNITYPDGESETVTVKTNWIGFSSYVAGNFNVYTDYFETQEIKMPGIEKIRIVLHGMNNGVEYEGSINLDYFYIPSPAECFYLVDSYFRSLISLN